MAAQRQADIIGKPSRFIFDCVSQEYGINPERTVMVGDRLDTDILLGSTCSLKTILTLTGVSSLEDVKSNQESDCMFKKKMVVGKWRVHINDGRWGCRGGRMDAAFTMERFSSLSHVLG